MAGGGLVGADAVERSQFRGRSVLDGVGVRLRPRRLPRSALPGLAEIDDLPGHSRSAAKVSQASISPLSKPRANQRWRWAEEPWVKLSGTTVP